MEWPTQVAKRLLTRGRPITYAVAGSDAIGTAIYMLGTTAGATGLPTPVGGSKWDGSRRGLVILHTGLNDAGGYTDRSVSPPVPVATDAAHQAGMTGALRTALALLSSAARVEIETGTLTGTWTNVTGNDYSGAAYRYTTTPGDKVDVPVTVPASGRVHLVVIGLSATGTPNSPFSIAVDGAVVKNVSAAEVTMRQVKTTATLNLVYAPIAVEITAPPGARTITITHTGANGTALCLDTIIIPSATPPPIFVPQEWSPIANVNQWNQAQVDIIKANQAVLNPLYQAVVAEFPNAKWTPMASVTTGGVSTNDGLHQNDRGHTQEADDWVSSILSFLQVYDPDNLYLTLGGPGNYATRLYSSGTWSPASGSTTRVGFDSMITITGGTVTSVSIDGTVTGLTSGTFFVPAGSTMSAVYTVAPTYTWFDMT